MHGWLAQEWLRILQAYAASVLILPLCHCSWTGHVPHFSGILVVGRFGLHTACCAFNGPGIGFPGSLRAGCTQDRGKERKGGSARDVFCRLQIVHSCFVHAAGVSFDPSLERFRQREHDDRAQSNLPAFGPCSQARARVLRVILGAIVLMI